MYNNGIMIHNENPLHKGMQVYENLRSDTTAN
jgi:hypothetical protein